MIDLEKVESKIKFGDVVRFKEENDIRYKYLIFVGEEPFIFLLTDGKGYFHFLKRNTVLERIGSTLDENIINLLKSGDE